MKHSRKNLSAGRLLYQRFERIAQLSEGDSKGLGYSGASKSGGVFAAGPHLTGKMPRLPLLSGIPD